MPQAWATVALAIITSPRWSEERRRLNADRVRARSEDAAWTALTALGDSGLRPGEGSPESVRAVAREVFHALERCAPFVANEELADRMKVVGVIAWMMSWSPDALSNDRIDEGLLSIRLRYAAERCAAALQSYLTDRQLPPWEELPDYRVAQEWVWRECRSGG